MLSNSNANFVTSLKILWRSVQRFQRYAREQTDRQTYRQDKLTLLNSLPYRAGLECWSNNVYHQITASLTVSNMTTIYLTQNMIQFTVLLFIYNSTLLQWQRCSNTDLVYVYRVIFNNSLSLQHLVCFFHLRLMRENLTPAIQQLNALQSHSVWHLTAHVLQWHVHKTFTTDVINNKHTSMGCEAQLAWQWLFMPRRTILTIK